ncbi:retrotransposon unclassified [Moniliophthora roreri MCA 2997]|uniref:Retrotransposon unclassified n=1 Tax=Moniliophthora roreri (strain MCA 2997) TaxID=1381753 RepID=V2WT98_MONRO|nr:retrotransposon unclassified [Moniliophthora roreri MCA 2997]
MSTSPSPPPPPPPRPSTSMWEVKAMWLMAFSSCLTQSLLNLAGIEAGWGAKGFSSDVEEHLKSFQECFSTLKKLDFNVSSYLEAALLLATLSANLKDLQSWYSFICAQLVNKETKLSDIVFSMGKATHADAAIAPQSGSAVESALATLERDAREKGRYWCMNCRKDSHTKSYCTKPSGGRAGKKNKKKKGKGSKGKEKAHAAEDSGGGEVSNVVLTDLDLVTSIHIKFDHLSFSNAPISNEREYKWLTSLQSNNADPISIDNNGIDTPSALSASASSSDSVKPPSSPVSTPSAPKLEQPSTPTPSPSSSLPAQCPKAMPKSWPNLSVPPLHTHYAAAKEVTASSGGDTQPKTSHAAVLSVGDNPQTLAQALNSPECKHMSLCHDEQGCIVEHHACLVAQGFSQIPGVDFWDTYVPVARIESIHAISGLVATLNWEIHVVDVKSAFLNSEIPVDQPAYVAQPSGHVVKGKENWVWLLHKALYRLYQSAFSWYQKLKEILITLGFKPCPSNLCVFVHHTEKGTVIITSHVDDLGLFASSKSILDDFKSNLSKHVVISDKEISQLLDATVT